VPKSVAQKLALKPGLKFLLLNAPPGYEEHLGPLPEGVKRETSAGGIADVIQVFMASRKELESSLPRLKKRVVSTGTIWVTYPKGTSKLKSDLNRDSIREYAATIGLETVAIFSVDEDWSALRLKVAG